MMILLDMDGVLTDFPSRLRKFTGYTEQEFAEAHKTDKKLYSHIWKLVDQAGIEFWSEMKWMPDGKELWNYLKDKGVSICSSPSRREESKIGKRRWCARELSEDISVILTSRKEDYASSNTVLIDDRLTNILKFQAAGGMVIQHTDAESTIKQLKKILGE